MTAQTSIRCRAPGKIILSGEHSVVHGSPALVTAVDRYCTVSLTRSPEPSIRIEVPTLGSTRDFSFPQLEKLNEEMKARYQGFLAGSLDIRDVVSDPIDLLAGAVAMYRGQNSGLQIIVESDIPLGAGMGSSAAILAALLHSLSIDAGHTLSLEELESQTVAMERYQHGHPSGVDSAICVRGGLIQFSRERGPAFIQEEPPKGALVFTGKPTSTTGECVEQVRRQFEGNAIWNEFSTVTQELINCLPTNDASKWMAGIRMNHDLLVRIGVVPKKIQCFIRGVEERGGAAKICGAGNIRGDTGGMMMVYGDEHIAKECELVGYSCMNVTGGVRGVEAL